MTSLQELNFYVHFCNCNPLNQIIIQLQILIGTTVAFFVNDAKKVTCAMSISNENAIISKTVADLYIDRMRRLNAPKCQCNKPEKAAIELRI